MRVPMVSLPFSLGIVLCAVTVVFFTLPKPASIDVALDAPTAASCPPPTVLPNTQTNCSSSTYCEYTCRAGYEIRSGSSERRCIDVGEGSTLWLGFPLECQKRGDLFAMSWEMWVLGAIMGLFLFAGAACCLQSFSITSNGANFQMRERPDEYVAALLLLCYPKHGELQGMVDEMDNIIASFGDEAKLGSITGSASVTSHLGNQCPILVHVSGHVENGRLHTHMDSLAPQNLANAIFLSRTRTRIVNLFFCCGTPFAQAIERKFKPLGSELFVVYFDAIILDADIVQITHEFYVALREHSQDDPGNMVSTIEFVTFFSTFVTRASDGGYANEALSHMWIMCLADGSGVTSSARQILEQRPAPPPPPPPPRPAPLQLPVQAPTPLESPSSAHDSNSEGWHDGDESPEDVNAMRLFGHVPGPSHLDTQLPAFSVFRSGTTEAPWITTAGNAAVASGARPHQPESPSSAHSSHSSHSSHSEESHGWHDSDESSEDENALRLFGMTAPQLQLDMQQRTSDVLSAPAEAAGVNVLASPFSSHDSLTEEWHGGLEQPSVESMVPADDASAAALLGVDAQQVIAVPPVSAAAPARPAIQLQHLQVEFDDEDEFLKLNGMM